MLYIQSWHEVLEDEGYDLERSIRYDSVHILKSHKDTRT